MNNQEPSDSAELLRAALAQPVRDDPMRQLARGSLLAFVARDPGLQALAQEMTSPVRAELDLHLDGAGVSNHETRAFELGRFMNRTATAVKEIAKSLGGLGRLASNLQVVAPAAGSVRVIFRAPDHVTTQEPLEGTTTTESIESKAMRKLVALLLQAEEEDVDNSTLDAAFHELQGQARRAVRLVGETVLEGHWRLDGELRRRGQPTAELSLSEGGAQRLVEAAGTTNAEVTTSTLLGVVDGWVWSEGVMSFEPQEGRRLRAAVTEPLQAHVADLVHEPRPTVRAVFSVVSVYPPGDSRYVRRSYALEDIDVVDQQVLVPQEQ